MLRFATCAIALLASGMAAPEEGLTVRSELVRTACGACHQPDERNVMSRISFQRKTPEGWQETLKRMTPAGLKNARGRIIQWGFIHRPHGDPKRARGDQRIGALVPANRTHR